MSNTKTDVPCKECIVFAICKLKKEIICNKATDYCKSDPLLHTQYDSDRIYEIIDYLGKGGAYEATSNDICFSDVFDQDGEKLN